MSGASMKVDMHVHSKFSETPSYWFLKKIGCRESYTEPVDLYHIARSRGMDLVTITDHDVIEGNLEIAHLDDTFVSEEITASFPGDDCKIHVLAYNISESQHEDIQKIRENIFDLVDYLNRQGIFNVLAHPLYSVNQRLSIEHFEKCLLLFKTMELNGSRDDYQSRMLIEILEDLTPERIDDLAEKHGVEPYGENPWEKRLIGGSDDHCGLNIAQTYTEIEASNSVLDFLSALAYATPVVHRSSSSPKTLAHTIYSIAYQYFEKKHRLHRYYDESDILRFFDNTLNLPVKNKKSGFSWMKKFLRRLWRLKSNCSRSRSRVENSADNLMNAAHMLIGDNNFYGNLNEDPLLKKKEKSEIWFQFAQKTSDDTIGRYSDDLFKKINDADLFNIFQPLSFAASLYGMMAPYFLSYAVFTKDRRFAGKCRDKFRGRKSTNHPKPRKVAFFSDTYGEVNGVAKAIQVQMEMAAEKGAPMTLITCEPGLDGINQKNFEPVGAYSLPEYPELKMNYPPVLRMLEYCYRKSFTHIHSETPGPLGLAAYFISRILMLPFNGTYHTSLPQTVRLLTGDSFMEDATWKFVTWYYGQMDRVYAPSEATARELAEKGIEEAKISVFKRGIDIQLFHPRKRNGFFKNLFELGDDCLKLLYVGRMSKEKNLKLLAEALPKIFEDHKNISLIMVGDGPLLPEMKKTFKGLPVFFTGYLHGEDLAQAYASADIFVFPSVTDTCGNVILEAQASGLPVVVSEKGGPRENMVHGRTGFVFSSDSPEVFIKNLRLLVDNPSLLSHMKQNARRFMKDRSQERMFKSFWNSYY